MKSHSVFDKCHVCGVREQKFKYSYIVKLKDTLANISLKVCENEDCKSHAEHLAIKNAYHKQYTIENLDAKESVIWI